jgi:ABC-2 type transport system permease protein
MKPLSQARLFQRLRWRVARNAGTQLFGNSRTRLFTMIAISVLAWFAIFGGALWGFDLLAKQRIPVGSIIEMIFNALFFTLGGMLVFSSGLVLYAGLFNGAETRFLLTTPARADHIFATKLQSAIAFSSWAFFVVGVPVLIAYGLIFDAVWYFYPLLFVFFLGYVLLPGGIGALICLALVNFFPHRRKQALIVLIVLLIAALGYWIYRTALAAKAGFDDRDQLQGVFDMFTLTKGRFSPSDWMATGLLAVGRGDLKAGLLPLALIWSNGLLLYVLSAYAALKLYRRGYNRMSTGGNLRKRYGRSGIDRVMEWLVFYLDRPTRILIIKDFRTLRREPAQIGQIVIFTGLMLLAVLNSRQFYQADIPVAYQHGLSIVNMSATGLLMCAYLGRFIYPLLSLEGRKFWILGLMPLKRDQLVWGKFAFAITGSLLLAGGIIFISDIMLGLPPVAIVLHALTTILLAVGLSGLSVGLSAWLPNFRETDPSKIVLGFGGTVNMLVSLVYLVVTIGLVCGPYHAASAMALVAQRDDGLPLWAFAGIPFGIILASLATWVPMKIGIRNLRTIEF